MVADAGGDAVARALAAVDEPGVADACRALLVAVGIRWYRVVKVSDQTMTAERRTRRT